MITPNFASGIRRTITVGVLAAALTLAAGTPRAAGMLSALNAAVLDWCDTRAGVFHLPHISAPSCETGKTLYLGTLKGTFAVKGATGPFGEPDAAWWWNLRTNVPPNHMIGVLWYVPASAKDLCAASEGKICPCFTAIAALNNPARVPVVLIGPGAAMCEAEKLPSGGLRNDR